MKPKKLPRNAVKEAFDNLPAGICFFNDKGFLVLGNRRMYRLAFELTGRDLQVQRDLAAALKSLPENSRAVKDGEIYLLADGTAWQFVHRVLWSEDCYTEYIAVDVTELYKRTKELQISTVEHEKMVADMKRIVDHVTAITREEEILTMKMHIHSEVGVCLQRLRRFHVGGCDVKEKEEIVNQLQEVVKALKGEIGNTDEVDAFGELLRVAAALGVTVSLDGEMTENRREKNLLVMAVRECITNTLRHARGNTVFVSIDGREREISFVITNDGVQPKEDIVEGGGLTSLRWQIEKAGGCMAVQSLPRFALTVTIPREREENQG